MERIQTKALVEGAIFAGVTALIGILYYYLQYTIIIAMLWPIPVIIVGYRNGLKASILSALSAGLIVSLMTHPFVGLGLLIGFGLPGILMGYMVKKKMNPFIIILLCGLLLSFTMVGEIILSSKAAGIDIFNTYASMDTVLKQELEEAFNIYRQQGIPETTIKTMNDFFTQMLQSMKLIFPSALVVWGMIFSLIDYKLTRLILKRIGYVIDDIEEFSKWRLKEPYSFILLGLAAIAVVISYFKITQLNAVIMNITMILMLAFFVVGVSVIVYYSKVYGDRQGIPKVLRNTIVIFIVITFMQYISLVGIVDMVFDFRKLESRNRLGGER